MTSDHCCQACPHHVWISCDVAVSLYEGFICVVQQSIRRSRCKKKRCRSQKGFYIASVGNVLWKVFQQRGNQLSFAAYPSQEGLDLFGGAWIIFAQD